MSFAQFIHDYIELKISSLTCPITAELFQQPVYYKIHNVKQIFESVALNKWREKNFTCPNTRTNITNVLPVIDIATSDAISRIKPFIDESGKGLSVQEIEALLNHDETAISAVEEWIQQEFLHASKLKTLDAIKQFEPYLSFFINVKDRHGWTALHHAAYAGNTEMVSYLLKANAPININASNDWTPLCSAIAANNPTLVDTLLKAGAISTPNNSPLNLAVKCALPYAAKVEETAKWYDNKMRIVSQLLDSTPIIAPTILHSALISHQSRELLELLLARGAKNNINYQDEFGNTPLHYAVLFNDKAVINLILDNGAHLNTPNGEGNTPLHIAATKKQNENTVEYLLSQGAEITIRNRRGETPLQTAEKQPESHVFLYMTINILRQHEQKHQQKAMGDDEATKWQFAIDGTSKFAVPQQSTSLQVPTRVAKFALFQAAYLQAYQNSFFFQKPLATMIKKLANGSVKNIDDVEEYARQYPESRTAEILTNINRRFP